jgi:hypothetical protein
MVSERTGVILDFEHNVDREEAEREVALLNERTYRGFHYALAKVVLVDE